MAMIKYKLNIAFNGKNNSIVEIHTETQAEEHNLIQGGRWDWSAQTEWIPGKNRQTETLKFQ